MSTTAYYAPDKVRARDRARYVRLHAPRHHAALLSRVGEDAYDPCNAAAARQAVVAAGLLFDALPQDPDADQGADAPAPAGPQPIEPEATVRVTTCSCTGTQPCCAECRRSVPELRQDAGPEDVTRAARTPLAKRLQSLADCQQSQDPAAVAAYHAHLASSGLQSCGACGLALSDAAHDPGRPFTPEEVKELAQRISLVVVP